MKIPKQSFALLLALILAFAASSVAEPYHYLDGHDWNEYNDATCDSETGSIAKYLILKALYETGRPEFWPDLYEYGYYLHLLDRLYSDKANLNIPLVHALKIAVTFVIDKDMDKYIAAKSSLRDNFGGSAQ